MDVSANVRAEIARARRDGRSVAAEAQIPRSTWQHRMDFPETWKIAEVIRVAGVLGVSVDVLFATP